MGTGATRTAVAHLLRRATFGATREDVDRLAAGGYEAAVATVCDLQAPDPGAESVAVPHFDTAGFVASRGADLATRRAAAAQARRERELLPLWWLRRMVAAERPAREKLTFLWHEHFATGIEKVLVAELMYRQFRTLYDLGPGRFDELCAAMAQDPAMLRWLDGVHSTARAPNENFSRELLELFTLGHPHHDHGGSPLWTERDVTEAARALTGWVIDRETGHGVLDPARHDTGVKTVLGVTGNLGLHEVVAAAIAHPACAPHVVSRLWSRLARPAGPDDSVVRELASTFAEDLDTTALLERIFLHPAFQSAESRNALLKTPVELIVGTARALGTAPDERTVRALRSLGQVPFDPPDVSGWPTNEAWLSTSSAHIRLRIAQVLAPTAEQSPLADAAPTQRAELAGELLGVERWSRASLRALRAASGDPRSVLAVALVAPEHLAA